MRFSDLQKLQVLFHGVHYIIHLFAISMFTAHTKPLSQSLFFWASKGFYELTEAIKNTFIDESFKMWLKVQGEASIFVFNKLIFV